MAARRRNVTGLSDEDELESSQNYNSPASSNEEDEDGSSLSPARQTSFRVSRKTNPASGQSQLTARASSSRGGATTATNASGAGRRSTASRVRRATPLVRAGGAGRRSTTTAAAAAAAAAASRRREQPAGQGQDEQQVLESYSDDEETQDELGNSAQRAHIKSSTTQQRNRDGTTTIRRSRRVSRRATAGGGGGGGPGCPALSWYERLMPDFMLNMTAPLTGYENQVDESDIEQDEEYEILDRSRIKRNRRIRRRLITLMLLAAAASLFMYTRGRVLKKVGVKAAVSSMKQRIEDGISKTVHETMAARRNKILFCGMTNEQGNSSRHPPNRWVALNC